MIEYKSAQLETKDAQIETEGEFEAERKEVAAIDILSTPALQKLTMDELMDKWTQLDGEYMLGKWKLALHISDKFNSKKEFGQFLQELRIANPHHALCTINQSTLYRYARAAKFCDRFEIYDLKEIGISPTAIYDLSEIKNGTVVDEIFVSSIKNKNLHVSEIKRLICQTHSITGELIPESESTMSPEMELPAQDFEHLEAIRNETQTMHDVIEKHEVCVEPEPLTSQPVELRAELTNQLTEEGMVHAVLNLIDSFNLSNIEKLNLLTATVEKIKGIEFVRPDKLINNPINSSLCYYNELIL